MTKESFIQKVREAKDHITNNRLANAFELFTTLATAEGQYKVTDVLMQIKQTYSYMIHYMMQGVEDSSRTELYNSIKEELQSIADDLLINELAVESPELYYSSLRVCILNNYSFAELLKGVDTVRKELLDTKEDSAKKALYSKLYNYYHIIFDILWTSRKNNKHNELLFNWIVENKDNTELVTYFLVPAVLSLLKYYDSKKLALFINLYNAEISEHISAISMVAILMAFNTHLDRVRYDAEVVSNIKNWSESDTVLDHIRTIAKHILHTFDTERAFTKMNNEVIPELIKMRPEFIRRFGDIKLSENIEDLENNPAWEEIMENTGLADKLKELSEMQSEGADLMMISFSNLKQFHFFNAVDAWFVPFSPMHPAFSNNEPNSFNTDILESLGNALCDSDKYSLAFALQKLPANQSSGMINQLQLQLEQAKEALGSFHKIDTSPVFEDTARSFIKTFHRFFKLFNKRNEFENPFNKLWRFDEFPIVGKEIVKDDISKVIAEYYFKLKQQYNAIYWYKNLESQCSGESYYWEKIGYSYQCLNKYDEALQSYRRAELLKNPNLWLLKQLAAVSMKLGHTHDALNYYNKALELDPENLLIIFNIGNLYLESGNIPQAIQSFYHANYIDPENIKIWRAIGWSELLNKNYDKSEQYYNKILTYNETNNSDTLKSTDFMNAGHIKLLKGKLQDAYNLYKKSLEIDPNSFEKDFIEDTKILKSLNVDPLTLDILLDHIKFND